MFALIRTLKFKFALIAVVLFAAVVGGGVASYRAMQQTADVFGTYVDANTPRVVALTELETHIARMDDDVLLLVSSTSSTPQLLDRIFVELGRVEQTYRSYRAFGATNEQFTALLTYKEAYVYALLAFRDAYETGTTTTMLPSEYAAVVSAHNDLVTQVRKAFVAETEAQGDAARALSAHVAGNTQTQMLLGVSGVTVLILVVVFVYLLVFRPLTALRATALAIAHGDERQTAAIARSDELGDVARAFNLMVQRLRAAHDESEDRAHKLDRTLHDLAQVTKTTTEERALFEQLLASIADGVLVFDASQHVVFANAPARTLLGEHIVGTTAESACFAYREGVGVQTCVALVGEAFAYAEPHVFERDFVIVDARGVRTPVALTLAPVRDEQGVPHHLVLTFRDVTELVRLEEARVSFLSAASHQLRTPLSSMRWFSEMFLDGSLGKMTKKQVEAMKNFAASTLRMVGLVNSLLQLSRVEARRVEIKPEPIDVIILAQEVADSLRQDAAEKEQTIVVTSRLKKAAVAADRELVRQAIMNFITNALRYGNPKTQVTVSIAGTKTAFEVAVTNEGVGVPEPERGRIFEKFYRATNAQKMVPNGNGIGLSLVKFLVEDWGGEIGFESIQNKTTTFHFSIPKKGMVARRGEVSLAV